MKNSESKKTKVSREKQNRNNLSAARSRKKAKQRAMDAFRDVEILKTQIIEYKTQIASLETKTSLLEIENKFYKNQMLMNCVFLPPVRNTQLPSLNIDQEKEEMESPLKDESISEDLISEDLISEDLS